MIAAVPPALVLVAAALVATVGRRVGRAVGVVAATAALAWTLWVPTGTHLAVRAFGAPPFGFDLVLVAVDPVSRAVGAALALAGVAGVAFAAGTRASTRQTAVGLVYVGASLGAVFAGDWLSLVVWWELMAVAATLLLWASPDAVRAGYRYAVYHQLGGAALVAGVVLHYTRTGTFVFGDGLAPGLPLLLAVCGAGLNVGFLGLHVWVVDAYPRPHVASTVVLSAFTTKVGVYTLVRLLPGESLAVAAVGGAMVLVGVTMAVLQTDLRRLLSYHIVSQVGYMVVGVGLGTAAGTAGGVAHLVNNVLYKTLLFVVAGAVVVATGRESLKRLGGLGRRMPRTTVAFGVAALAITGIPGFSGFVSKGVVTSAASAADADALWWALQVGAVGTVVSFAKVGYYAFLRAPPDEAAVDGARDLGPTVTVAMAALAVPCVVFGLAPGLFVSLLPPGASATTAYSTAKLTDATLITVAGVVVFVATKRPLAHLSSIPDLDRVYHPLGRAVHDRTSAVSAALGRALSGGAARVATRATTTVTDPRALDRLGPGRTSIGRGVLLVALAAVLLVLVLLG